MLVIPVSLAAALAFANVLSIKQAAAVEATAQGATPPRFASVPLKPELG